LDCGSLLPLCGGRSLLRVGRSIVAITLRVMSQALGLEKDVALSWVRIAHHAERDGY
jgi:hypothetical protein